MIAMPRSIVHPKLNEMRTILMRLNPMSQPDYKLAD